MKRLIVGVAFCGLVSVMPVHAAINKCTGADGKVYFTDKPCPSQTKLESTELTAEEKREQRWKAEEAERRKRREAAEVNHQRELLERSIQMEKELTNWRVYSEKNHGLFRSEWNGSIPAVERALKRSLNDPESLVIENCDPVMTNGKIIKARCRYRAKNGFGAYIKKSEVFHFDSGGSFIKSTESTGKALAFE